MGTAHPKTELRRAPGGDEGGAGTGGVLRRAALVALGASGEDLTDAQRLLATDDDADEAPVQQRRGPCALGIRNCSAPSAPRRLRPGPGRARPDADDTAAA
jgi:hypothetical protein